MHRRHVLSLAATAGVAASVFKPVVAWAQAGAFRAGPDFLPVSPLAPVDAPAGKIELIEFFWYNCPHCNAFEPVLSPWVKQLPSDVVFKRIPVAFNDSMVPQQRLFYALQAMGSLEQLHARVFAAIHVGKIDLKRGDAITNWLVQQGVDRTAFASHFTSVGVATQASRAIQMTQAYRVDGVPALGIAGRYYTDGALAGSMERLLRVAEFLIEQVRAGR
ncbi:MAG: disulfide bond formation protein DsbA [Comamonadaceae bacterium CG1_02_60_18]|nr:MAG: disulfide bond formation protein DsbA [Comamonadaceae bacterium CG1_02_60_18]PIQ55510.1 MAG: disulfide bond formation protein DsbA [Comamonadaceae bacterium CG12_big_fil_rev_8_21_14_0_65_59_15]